MKKIAFVCAAGMSTSLLVNKMKETARSINYDCEISAYPLAAVEQAGTENDIIILGPQVGFKLDEVKGKVSVPVSLLSQEDFSAMDGKKIINDIIAIIG